MKRLVFLVVVLVAAVDGCSCAWQLPLRRRRATSGTRFGGVQRHLTFNAIQSKTDTCGTFWNVTGVSQFSFRLTDDTTDYTHHVTLTQNGQSVGGSGGFPLTGGDDVPLECHRRQRGRQCVQPDLGLRPRAPDAVRSS